MNADSRQASTSDATASRLSVAGWMVLSLVVLWVLEVILYGVVLLTVYLVPNCELGGKITQTSCGSLTSVLSTAHVFAFYLGSVLVVATLPWIIATVIAAWLGRRRNAA